MECCNFYCFGYLKLNAYFMSYEIYKFKTESKVGRISGEFEKVIHDMFNANVSRNYAGFPKIGSEYFFTIDKFRCNNAFYVWWTNEQGITRHQLIGSLAFVEKSKIKILIKIFRLLIRPEIISFKKKNKILFCPITGKMINNSTVIEADHVTSFVYIVREFLKQYGEENVVISGTGYNSRIDNKSKNAWITFHKKNSNLRLVSYEGHLELNKIYTESKRECI